jgi:hypothetical protein
LTNTVRHPDVDLIALRQRVGWPRKWAGIDDDSIDAKIHRQIEAILVKRRRAKVRGSLTVIDGEKP